MGNAGSISGLVIDLKEILNRERWNKFWIELCLLSYGWYVIKNVWCRTKKSFEFKDLLLLREVLFVTFHIILCLHHRNISMLILYDYLYYDYFVKK